MDYLFVDKDTLKKYFLNILFYLRVILSDLNYNP